MSRPFHARRPESHRPPPSSPATYLACALLVAGAAALGVSACGSGDSGADEKDAAGTGTGGSGSGGTSGSSGPGICEPVGAQCDVKVIDGPEGSGSECLAMRDNTDADHVQMRQVWARVTQPAGNTIDIVYGTLLQRAELSLPSCNMKGFSGYIKAFDWDRSSATPTDQTLRLGWTNFVEDAGAAVEDGVCLVEYDYVAPDQGLTTPWNAGPVLQRRVADDFTVEDMRGTVTEGEGVFYYDEAKAETHHYSPLEYVIMFDNASKAVAIPMHEVEMRLPFNDGASLNCAGAYRADALDPKDECFSAVQDNPSWGCEGGGCPAGEGPAVTTGYFLITELEKIYTTVLQSTLCVSYPGQQVSIDDGWANPDDWGLNCSGSPKWNPDDPASGLPMGDWCSETNSAATDACHDAYRSHTFGVFSAFPVQASNCQTDAKAPSTVTK